MKSLKVLTAAALAVGMIAVAPTASADEACVGTEETVLVCAEPLGRTLFSDCVYVGGDTCMPVSVPGPDVTRCKAFNLHFATCQIL